MSSLLVICIGVWAAPGCTLPDSAESAASADDPDVTGEPVAEARPLEKEDMARLGIDASAGTCFLEVFQHAHFQGVARETVNVSGCSDGMHTSIDLTDTLCEHRAAQVKWELSDSVGTQGSGTNTNGAGCNTTRTFTLPTRNSVEHIHTVLLACNTTGCSTEQPFDDFP
jgi:hypothetical protein